MCRNKVSPIDNYVEYSENGENGDKIDVLRTGRRGLYLEILLMHDVKSTRRVYRSLLDRHSLHSEQGVSTNRISTQFSCVSSSDLKLL
jgi:hypothetical protein